MSPDLWLLQAQDVCRNAAVSVIHKDDRSPVGFVMPPLLGAEVKGSVRRTPAKTVYIALYVGDTYYKRQIQGSPDRNSVRRVMLSMAKKGAMEYVFYNSDV